MLDCHHGGLGVDVNFEEYYAAAKAALQRSLCRAPCALALPRRKPGKLHGRIPDRSHKVRARGG
jgi:hypothetical protein